MQLSAESLAAFLEMLPGSKRYLLAYSGGLDSHVLLHLLAQPGAAAGYGLRAVHVNHNIQPQSRAWARHCQDVCRDLGVALETLEVDASAPDGESPEAWARQQRYAAIEKIMAEGEILLTAHHQDDQLETFLLRLLRGAGTLGLGSMRPLREFGKGLHARPLLSHPRAQLLDYAGRHQLTWIEDPSNTEQRFDRNYLRHEVLPMIAERWLAYAEPLSRTIKLMAETQEMLEQLARLDLQNCATESADLLSFAQLRQLPQSRQKNLLRYWCRSLNLPSPDSRQAARIVADLLRTDRAANARVGWRGAELRRHGDDIQLAEPLAPVDSSAVYEWDFMRPCRLQEGELTAVSGRGNGLRQARCAGARIEVRYRRGGEKLRLPGRAHRHRLKKLFQAAGVPPWLRARVPLIYLDGELAMVAGYWTAAGFLAAEAEPSWIISWSRLSLSS